MEIKDILLKLHLKDLLRSESRSRIEYLMSTNNIMVHDSYLNLTNKSNLIDRF